MDAQEWLVVNALPGMGALRIAQLVARQPQWPEGLVGCTAQPSG